MKKGLCLVLSALAIVSGGMTSTLSVDAAVGSSGSTSVSAKTSTSVSKKVSANSKSVSMTRELVVGKIYQETYSNTFIKGNITVDNTSILSVVAKKTGNSQGKNKIIIKGLKEGIASVKYKTADGVEHTIKIVVSKYKYSDIFQNTVKIGSMTYQSECTLKDSEKLRFYKAGRRIEYVKSISGSGKVEWKTGKWGTEKSIGYVTFSVKATGKESVQVKYTDGYADIIRFTTEITPKPQISAYSSESPLLITYGQFMNMGVVNWGGQRWTYYSQSVLPGYGLNIPGRHVDGGYVCDGDGYIVLARNNSYRYGDIVHTPFGRDGKCYDYCPEGNLDVYVQ